MHNNRESRPDRSVSADRRGCRTAPGTGGPVNRNPPAISPVRCSHYPLFPPPAPRRSHRPTTGRCCRPCTVARNPAGWSVQAAVGRRAGQTVAGVCSPGPSVGSARMGAKPTPCRPAPLRTRSSSAGGGARRRSPVLHVPWMTGIEPITPARRRLTPARQVTVGVTCYRSPHHRRETRMRDEDDSRVPGRTRHNPEDPHTGGAGSADGEVRPDADLGAARGAAAG